jgi:UDP-glucuronate 4-epimerase
METTSIEANERPTMLEKPATSTILVTGCAGFIASRVTEMLLDDGQEVVGIDNLNDAYDKRLKEWRLARLIGRSGFTFHRLDLGDTPALRAVFDADAARGNGRSSRPPYDAVVNLAARAGVRQSVENPWVYVDTNLTGTLNLLELCRHFGVGKFVLASTSSLYGNAKVQPFREDFETNTPLSPYAASKKAAEALCYTYHYLYGIDVTIPRYFTVYGPAGRPDMSLFRFVQWISEGREVLLFGDGQQSRDFTFVDDIARGTCAAIRPVGYEIVNLGSDEPVVLADAVRLIEELVGRRATFRHADAHPADVLATWADIGKAEQLLGWRPQVSFEEGVRRLVRWYGENREWAKSVITD